MQYSKTSLIIMGFGLAATIAVAIIFNYSRSSEYPELALQDSLNNLVASVEADRGVAFVTFTDQTKYEIPWAKNFEFGEFASLSSIISPVLVHFNIRLLSFYIEMVHSYIRLLSFYIEMIHSYIRLVSFYIEVDHSYIRLLSFYIEMVHSYIRLVSFYIEVDRSYIRLISFYIEVNHSYIRADHS